MEKKHIPYKNAIIEIINKKIKYKYGLKLTIKSTKLAQKIRKRSFTTYSNIRSHFSSDLHTPRYGCAN